MQRTCIGILKKTAASKHTQRCLPSLLIRQVQMRITVRYYFIPVILQMVNKKWWRYGETGWEHKLVQLLWKPVHQNFRKLHIEPPYNPAIPLLVVYPRVWKTGTQIDTSVCSCILHKSQKMETTQAAMSKWVGKPAVVDTMGYYSVIERSENLIDAIAWLDLENIVLSEISEIQKDKYCMVPCNVSYLE